MTKEKLNEPHCVRLPDWMDCWVDQKAKDMKVSPAQIIRLAICCYIELEELESEPPSSKAILPLAERFALALKAIQREAA